MSPGVSQMACTGFSKHGMRMHMSVVPGSDDTVGISVRNALRRPTPRLSAAGGKRP